MTSSGAVVPFSLSHLFGLFGLAQRRLLQQFRVNTRESFLRQEPPTHPLPFHHNMICIWTSRKTAHLRTYSPTHFANFSAVQACFIPLCHAPEEADSWSSSQWDICISGLFFIRSIFPSQRIGALMSLKSHYG